MSLCLFFATSSLCKAMFRSDEERSVAGTDDEEYVDPRDEVEMTPKVGYVPSDSSAVLHIVDTMYRRSLKKGQVPVSQGSPSPKYVSPTVHLVYHY